MTIPYYEYSFVSPEVLYAEIREELRSYFESGAVDDTMFSRWTENCLDKLGKGMFKISQTLLSIEDGAARLPETFRGVREVWRCETIDEIYKHPSNIYTYVLNTSTRIDSPDVKCDVCNECNNPPVIQAMYKNSQTVFAQYARKHLLSPGNIARFANCNDLPCANMGSSSPDIYDVEENRLLVNFDGGSLYLVYYSEETDDNGFQMIPDNIYIKEYIKAYIEYKLWQQLFNMASDESFNQLRYKTESAKQEYLDKQVIAITDTKKETPHRKAAKIAQQRTRLNWYKLR